MLPMILENKPYLEDFTLICRIWYKTYIKEVFMDSNEIRNWILIVSAIGGIVLTATHFLRSMVYINIKELCFGFEKTDKSGTVMFLVLYNLIFTLGIIAIFALNAKFTKAHSEYKMNSLESGLYLYFLFIAVVSILYLYYSPRVTFCMFSRNGDEKVINSIIEIVKNKIIKTVKNKFFNGILYWLIIIISPIVIAYTFYRMIDAPNDFDANRIIGIFILCLGIYFYSVFLNGISAFIRDLEKLKFNQIIFNDTNQKALFCKIIQFKGDFIYYIENDKLTCINKSSVFKICEVKENDISEDNVNLSNDIEEENEEIAATLEEQHKKEQIKHESYQNNGNWNIEFSLFSVFGMVQGVYKSVKFLRKVFKKK